MAWTDITRPALKTGDTAALLNALKNNAEWLKDRHLVAHTGSTHNIAVNGSTTKGSYPNTVGYVTCTDPVGPPPTYSTEYRSHGTVTVTRTGVGTFRVDIASGTFGSAVDAYGVQCAPVTWPTEGESLVSRSCVVEQTSTTRFLVSMFEHGVAQSSTAAACEGSFTFAVWGDSGTTLSAYSGWTYLPDLPVGCPVTTEYCEALIDNVQWVRYYLTQQHRAIDGTHCSMFVPTAAGVLTYKNTLDQQDRREWVVEPWCYGLEPGDHREVTAPTYDSSSNEQCKLSTMRLGTVYSEPMKYGTLATMNPYQVGTDRARLVHPYQYRDSTVFAPRYHAGSGNWSWADCDSTGIGATDSIAFMRFAYDYSPGVFMGGDRLVGFGATGHAADGNQISLLLCTLLKEELDELRRLFEVEHSISDGTHDRSPPGIIGAGRVVWGGASYTLQSWSRGVGSVSAVSSPSGCRLTFSSGFNSFREWGILITPDVVTAATYYAPLALRANGAQADVYVYSGATPAAVRSDFNYVLIGAR